MGQPAGIVGRTRRTRHWHLQRPNDRPATCRLSLQRPCPCSAVGAASILLAALILLHEGSVVWGRVGGSADESLLSLFDVKEGSKLWDSAALVEGFDEIRKPAKFFNGLNEIDHYLRQADVAQYLDLHPIEALHIPVPINLILIGFSGNGNHGLKLGEAEVRRWFEHMDGEREHTFVPPDWRQRLAEAVRHAAGESVEVVAEEDEEEEEEEEEWDKKFGGHQGWQGTSREGGGGGGRQGPGQWTPKAGLSRVHYNFSVHAIDMGDKIAAVFENAIRALSRVQDPLRTDDDSADADPAAEASSDGASGAVEMRQVDMEGMALMINNLLDFLQLDSSAYNIVLLNPTRPKPGQRYGYRMGLSEQEFQALVSDEAKRKKLLSPQLEKIPQIMDSEHIPSPLFSQRPGHAFHWTSVATQATVHWAARYNNLIGSVERVANEHSDALSNTFKKAQQIITSGDYEQSNALLRALREGPGSNSYVAPCLVDTWTASRRWLMVDLSAGPFSWGPRCMGGRGVRTEASMPSVDRYYAQRINNEREELSESDMRRELAQSTEERFSSLEEDSSHELDVLLAELDVYEAFVEKHCSPTHRRSASPLCKELQQRLEDMKEELAKQEQQELEKDDGSIGSGLRIESVRAALKRLHDWRNAATSGEKPSTEGKSVEHHSPAEERPWDLLMSEVAAMTSSAVQHIVTPSTVARSYRYAERLSFHLYIIHQQAYYERRKAPGFVEEFKLEMARACLPSQQLQFSVHKLSIADDPALATAFHTSLRVLSRPSNTLCHGTPAAGHHNPYDAARLNGSHSPPQFASYLDSEHLQDQLQQLGDESGTRRGRSGRTSGDHQHSILQIPVFVFALPPGQRVFLDETLDVAKSMSDMVIAVQMEEPDWPTEVQCSGRTVHQNLGSPLAATVAASMEFVAGLVPSHVAFSAAHGELRQDWRWAAGEHPLAGLTEGAAVHSSMFQRDGMARSYIVSALENSVHVVNAAIGLLADETPHEDTFDALKASERHLTAEYNAVVDQWKQIASAAEELKFEHAVTLIPSLRDKSERFHKIVVRTVQSMHPLRCQRRRRLLFSQNGSGAVVGLVACAVLVSVLLCWLRPRQIKPKVN